MNDIEHDLRALFHERADRIVTAPAAPERVLRRGRRRQVGTVVVSSLAAVTLVAGSIAGLGGLLADRLDRGPAGPGTVVASGDAYGLHWTLAAWVDDGRYCTRLRWTDGDGRSATPPGGSASCGRPPGLLRDVRTGFSVIETESTVSFLVALVPRDRVEVLVVMDDGRRFSTRELTDAPPEWRGLRFAVVPLEGEGPATADFLGEGHDLQEPSVRFWSWGRGVALDASNLTHFATVPDDGITRIGSIELEGTRHTLSAWRETATSKVCLYLTEGNGSRATIAWCGTADGIEETPLLSIGPLPCDRQVGVLWGTVPADMGTIDLYRTRGPQRLETIGGPAALGDVRFVLSPVAEEYPGGAWLQFLNANGRPTAGDWLSASCLERPPEPPEA